jgi:hypothetical protein
MNAPCDAMISGGIYFGLKPKERKARIFINSEAQHYMSVGFKSAFSW